MTESMVIIVILVCFMVFLEIRNICFTKDLLDRIMSKSITELVYAQKERKAEVKVEEDRAIRL